MRSKKLLVGPGVIKAVINNIRDGLFGKLTFLFSKFLGTLNLINPLDFINDEVMKKPSNRSWISFSVSLRS